MNNQGINGKAIQNIPVTDSPNNDAFEAVVETYYQTLGYITSSGKWFWVWDKASGKKLRGYQDIDVLAVNKDETLIISVSSNLDDKVNTKRGGGGVNLDLLKKLEEYFIRAREYLEAVDEYKWMVGGERYVRYILAYNHAFQRTQPAIAQALQQKNIQTVSAREMFAALREHVIQPNLKIQSPLLRAIQLLEINQLFVQPPDPHHTL